MSARKTEVQLLDHVRRIAASSNRDLDALLEETTECSLAQYLVLRALAAHPEEMGALGPTDIARSLGCSKANAGQLVTRLEERGRVRKLVDNADGRHVALRLTAQGRDTYASCESALAEDAKRVFEKLDGDEKRQLLALLKKLA